MSIRRRIFKQGNSLVLSLPAHVVNEVGAKRGDYFNVTVVDRKWIVLSVASANSTLSEPAETIRLPPV
jgi:antitoxin component of MazEF toxin-antitoxin module